MATERLKTIKTAGGNYTSLSAAEAGEDDLGDIVSRDEWMHFECYSMEDTAGDVTIDGWTTDSTRYILIDVPTGNRHDAGFGTGYRLNTVQFRAVEGNVRVAWLSMECNGADFAYLFYFQPGSEVCDYRVYNCIIRNYQASTNPGVIGFEGSPSANSSVKINNCIALTAITGTARNSRFNHANYTGYIENCLFIGATAGTGCAMTAGTWYCKNTYSGNHSANNDYATGGTIAYTTCGSSDSADRVGVTKSIAYSISSGAYFTNVTAGAEDFHIQSDSVLIDAGTDLSADAGWICGSSIDIDGETRSGSWDIGADEYVAAGGESVTLTMTSCVQSNVGGVPSLALQTNLVVANSTNQNVGNAIGSPPLQTSLSIANGVNANIGNAISDVPLQAIVSTADGIQKNVGDAIGLTSEFLLELFDGIQQNVCDVANITVEFVLLTADGVQQNVTGLITLVVESDTGTEYTLTIYDGAQVQVGEALELSLETSLPTVDGAQRNYSDAIELVAEYLMSVLGSYHVNAGDAIGDLPIQITVTMSDGTQVIVSDAFDLSGKITLALANGIQITTDDMSAITIEALLNTLDGIQKNVGGEILLSVSSAGDIIARILRVVSKTPNRQITSKTPVRTIASKTTTKTIHLIVD